jgi:SNF2 family DNA or RNA helicase
MPDEHVIKLVTTTQSGRRIKVPATIKYEANRIWFLKSPFALKDEIKAMAGARWHGYDPAEPKKMWSVLDCERNRFQLQWLMGRNPYTWWEQPLKEWEYDRPLRTHQELMSNHMLTYHYAIIAAEMGTGKTLSAIECMEKSGYKDWWWVAPKSGLKEVEREFHKWGLSSEINVELMTYRRLRGIMEGWKDGDIPPPGVVYDESSRLKNAFAQRTVAAQNLADDIREHYGKDGFVIEMSGTPSAKSPLDWWAQAEIAWPGFLREGNPRAFELRMGVFIEKETMHGKHFQRVTWLDDENKCKYCGGFESDEQHNPDFMAEDYHLFEKSFNEVAYLYERLQGLTLTLHKKDCLDLPEKHYRTIRLTPSQTITRVAKALVKVAPNVITGMTWLRELSDGFQYQNIEDGVEKCSTCKDGVIEIWVDPEDSEKVFEMVDMLDTEYVETLEKRKVECPRCDGTQEVPRIVRSVKEIPCPKDDVVRQLLEENEEQGRLVIFAAFTGAIDRIINLCLKQKWAVVRIDGRGWKVYDLDGNPIRQADPLAYWADLDCNTRVVIVAHPQSGGLGLNLTESRMAVFYSNDFRPESRSQAEDRIHRIGTDENRGATIVDLIHLPTDERVRDILQDNRRLELMTLGEMESILRGEDDG